VCVCLCWGVGWVFFARPSAPRRRRDDGARDARGRDLFVDARVPRQDVRQAERGGDPSGGPGGGRRAAARAFRLRDGQLLQVHVVRDALQLFGVQRPVPGQHQAVQLRIR